MIFKLISYLRDITRNITRQPANPQEQGIVQMFESRYLLQTRQTRMRLFLFSVERIYVMMGLNRIAIGSQTTPQSRSRNSRRRYAILSAGGEET